MEGNTPPAQVAQVYRSGMQQPNAACTRAPPQSKSCPCVICIWLLHPAPIDIVQLALVVFFLPSTSANTPLALMVVIATCAVWWWWYLYIYIYIYIYSANTPLVLMMVIATCAGGVFPQSTSAFTNVHIATCTVWWWCLLCLYFYVVVLAVLVFLCGGGFIYVVIVAVHGGFAAVTQPRIHLEERSPREC